MRVLVTGGSGFIGAAVTAELEQRGHAAVMFDRREGEDILDPAALERAMLGCDGVVHLAGLLGTHELFDQVDEAVEVNMLGTANVLRAASRAGTRYVSTTMPAVFPSVYTATKLGAAALERAWHYTYGLPVARVKAYNAYGPGQRYGPGHPQKIVPTFATCAWRGEPIPIWGDGEQTVDLVHVDDLGRLLVDALDHGDDVTFDGGTGTALSVNEVARMVLDITGSSAGVAHLPMRRGELPTRIVAEGSGWERLDWKPRWELDRLAAVVESYR